LKEKCRRRNAGEILFTNRRETPIAVFASHHALAKAGFWMNPRCARYGSQMRAPLIGICTALERARWGVWDQQAALLPANYIAALQRSGAVAVMLPPDPAVTADPDLVLDVIDGLMLAGGADLDPALYGEEPAPQTQHPVRERDDFELALTRRALARDIPFLGICRGMQLLNVAQGGTLIQDLPTQLGHEEHCRNPGSFSGAEHPVHLAPGSRAAQAAGEEHHATLSHHHQGLARLGEDLVVSGWADFDELPEAIEVPDKRFALGVQWHPEADVASHVIATLVEEAREYALARTA
jgi:putative glutamine amidotransferase